MPRLTPSQQREILRNASREMRRTGRGRSIFQTLGSKFGPFGEILGIIGDILAGGKRPGRRHIEDAIKILSDQGFRVEPEGVEPPPIAEPPPVITGPPQRTKPAHRPKRKKPAEPIPDATTIPILPTRIRGAFESIPEDVTGFEGWVLTPQSSNIHMVGWDSEEKILYVCFRAEGKPIGYKDGISICSGKAYKIGIRPDVPGPIYSYGGRGRPVPREVFLAIATSSSPGKQVWDKLRVCGSQWQHRYPYTLTDIPANQRVPRKSTRRGMRVRTVPTVGMGRRGYRQSTLPERIR